MPISLVAAITAAKDRMELSEIWKALFKTDPPAKMSLSVMQHCVAFEFQVQKQGGIDRATLAAIKNWGSPGSKRKTAPKFKMGTRLIREWNGVTHIVEIESGGYVWQGKPYRSLSAIAKAITGTHWSGPRFFNLGQGQT